jgi:hypothetical protein
LSKTEGSVFSTAPGAKKRGDAVKLEDRTPDVAFEPADEARVTALMLNRNTSGRISPHVLKRLRHEMHLKFSEVGAACWRHGVDTAILKPAEWRYAVSVMRSNPDGLIAPQRPGKARCVDPYDSLIRRQRQEQLRGIHV